jgi:hypothetical protein
MDLWCALRSAAQNSASTGDQVRPLPANSSLETIFVKTWIPLFVASLFAAALLSQTPGSTPFLEKPYLQLGDAPNLSASESLVLMWHTANAPSDWKVEL